MRWILSMAVLAGACAAVWFADERRLPPAAATARSDAKLETIAPLPAAAAPKLLLAEDQRAPWIRAWNAMRECALQQGFDGISAVEPTFGDGATPAPIMHMSRPGAREAVAACPFDLSELDVVRLQAAVSASVEAAREPEAHGSNTREVGHPARKADE